MSNSATSEYKVLRRSHSLPHIASRHDSGVSGITATTNTASGSCSLLDHIDYDSALGNEHQTRHYNKAKYHNYHHHNHHQQYEMSYDTRLVADLRQLLTLRQHYYPEGGWGYVVLTITVIVQCVSHGLHMSSGILVSAIISRFRENLLTAGLIGSLSITFGLMISPVTITLCRRKSTRLLAVIGGLVLTLGCLFTSFAQQYHQVMFSYGIVVGSGVGITRDCTIIMIAQYFKKKREFVEVLTVASSGLGIIVMSSFLQKSIDALGWRYGLQCVTLSAISTFFLALFYRSAALYHPQRRAILHLKTQKRKVKDKNRQNNRVPFFDSKTLRSQTVRIILLSSACSAFGIYIPFVHLAQTIKNDKLMDAELPLQTNMGFAWIFGAIVFGVLVIRNNAECRIARQYLCQVSLFMCAICLLALTKIQANYEGYFIIVWTYGFFCGGYHYSLRVYLFERVRARNFSQAWSFVQCSQSIPIVVGVNLAEFLNCHVSHKSGYLFGFFCALSGSVLLFLVDVHKRSISSHRHTRSNGTSHLCKLTDCPDHRKLSFTQEPDNEPARNFNVGNLLLHSDVLGNQISEEFVIEPNASGNVVVPLDPVADKPELTCISEEGIADMDLPDNVFDDFDYIGDCITSCNKCNSNNANDGFPDFSDHNNAAFESLQNDKEDQGDMSFCMSNYARETMKMMFMMRSHHMLTDVVIEVQQELFHAHKVVLSAASPYFKAMFTGGLRESELSRVKLQGVCPTAMGRILYFMYSGHIRVTEVTVCTLLPAATMFQVSNVIDACCAFLERQLDPTNAIGIANFDEQHGCTTLKQRANQFIERHFTQISQEEEFLQLSAIELVQLIRKDELNVQEEREVYNAVLKWVKYDEDTRYPKMEHILYAVRCQFLTPNFLKEQMRNCDVLKKVPACREYLARIFKDLTLHKRSVVRERTPNTTRMIFVAGGYFRHSLDILEGFNVDDKTWTTLPRLRVPRSGLGAAFLKGTFYAVGGRNNSPGASYDSDWVDRYNFITERWRPCSPMSVPRNRVGVVVMDEFLYAIGGSAGSEYHNSVECYDPDEDRWTLVQPMHSKRLGVGVAVVNRLLFAIGGFDGIERLASIECYHPENNAWTILPPMKTGRSGAGVAALNQFIYVVGGFDGTRQLASVERYDTENQVWDTVAPIKIARSALSLTVLDGKLYAMGGFDGHSFLSIVELYDPAQDKWEESTPLTSGRSGHASAVIYQPSCVNQYMDCVDEPVDRSKESPDDDESKPGPSSSAGPSTSKSPAQSTSTSNQLHAFSGNRCTHCDDDENKSESDQENMERRMTRKESACSKYEQECREAIHSLLRMDHEEKIKKDQSQSNDSDTLAECIPLENDNSLMEISDEETNDYDSFDVDNPKKCRRKVSIPMVDSEMSQSSNSMSENSNSLDSGSASNFIPGVRNRLKARCNESGQCSLSRLKNKVRQNICDFVTWSVSSPLPKAIPQDSNSNNLTNLSNLPNANGTTEERKCDLLRKYYKCKLKYCNNSK